MTAQPVRLGTTVHPPTWSLVEDASALTGKGPAEWLGLAQQWGPRLPLPGHGETLARWELLASAGAVDLGLARTLEPHVDALAILAESGVEVADAGAGATWGVYAAEGPPPRLEARDAGQGWRLNGTKPWCSLAAHVSHALVTAWVGDDARGLFAVALRQDGVTVEDVRWVSRGLTSVVSGPISCADTPVQAVGSPGWYLRRDGFAWGGMGVAAVWYGAAVALARRLRRPGFRRSPDQLYLAHLGAVDVALTGARATLARAAVEVDDGRAGGADGELLAFRVRGVVADAVERVLGHLDHALGPGPLTQDEEHARRVADLRVYVRQHHAEHDDAALGTRLALDPDDPGDGRPGRPERLVRRDRGVRCTPARGSLVSRQFRHDGPGTTAAEWVQRPEWTTVPVWDPLEGHEGTARPERVLVVAAHPDDESLGAGGLVACFRRAGTPVTVVVATAGENSHPRSPTTTPTALGERRRDEAERAWAALGGDDGALAVWDLPDGGLAAREKELTGRLVEVVGDGRATLLLAPYPEDGHPDHDAVGRAAERAAYRTGAALAHYPVWLWHHADPVDVPWHRMRRLLLTPADRDAKVRAIACHRSQVEPLSDGPGDETLLGPSLLEHFTGPEETFVLGRPHDEALDDLHGEHDDPWGTTTRWYEHRKRGLVLAALPRRRYERGLDLGCSTGTLTVDLAGRCDTLVAVDSSPRALATAATRTQGLPQVELRRGDLSSELPEGHFDLVVLSEAGYFLSPVALDRLIDRVARALTADGCLVLAHWRHPIAGWPLTGPDVHARFAGATGIPPVATRHVERDVEIVVHAPGTALPDPYG